MLPVFIFLIISAVTIARPSLAEQARTPRRRSQREVSLSPVRGLSSELQSRVQLLESAKSAAEPPAIAGASRAVLAIALRELGNLQILDTPEEAVGHSTASRAVDAVETLRRSMDFEDSPITRLDLAKAYFRAARFDESLSAVTELLTANPDDAPARYVQGKLWLKKKQYEYATKSFGYVVSQQDDPAAAYLLGASFLQGHHLGEANEVFGRLRVQVGGTTSLHVFLAEAYRAANYLEESRRESQLAASPGKGQVLSSPIDRVLSNAAQLPSKFEPAKPTPRELAGSKRLQKELSSVLASALNDLGTAEAQQHQYSLALAHFHEAASWNAEVPGLLRNTGIAARGCRIIQNAFAP